MPVALHTPPPAVTLKMSPDIAYCALGGGAGQLLGENQWLGKEVRVFLSSTAHIQRALVDLTRKDNLT